MLRLVRSKAVLTLLMVAVGVAEGAAREANLCDVINWTRKDAAYLDEFLERPGVKVSDFDVEGWSLILWAAQSGETEMVRRLVKKGADVNQRTNDKLQTASLVCAAGQGWAETVRVLIELGADIKGDAGREAVRAATSLGTARHAQTVLVLGKAGAPLDGAVWGCVGDRRYALEAVLLAGGDVNERVDGTTPLMRAAAMGDLKSMRIILAFKPDLNALTMSWIHAGGGVAYLGSQPPEPPNNERTLLMAAAETGRVDVVRVLLESGADPMFRGTHGKTAIDLARAAHQDAVLKVLLAKP